jgi:hypothetical protein
MAWTDAASFCRETRSVRLANGEVVRLTDFLDVDGELTDDVDEAVTAVGPLADGQWVAVRLDGVPEERIALQ